MTTRRNSVLIAVVLVFAVGGVGLFTASRPADPEFDPAALDGRATAIRQQLGDLCSSFDFQLKEQLEDGVIRPIHCKGSGSEETSLRLFVFTDGDTRKAWASDLLLESSSHPSREEQVEFGEDWAVISFDEETLEAAAERLRSP